jgi:hypothetical protein
LARSCSLHKRATPTGPHAGAGPRGAGISRARLRTGRHATIRRQAALSINRNSQHQSRRSRRPAIDLVMATAWEMEHVDGRFERKCIYRAVHRTMSVSDSGGSMRSSLGRRSRTSWLSGRRSVKQCGMAEHAGVPRFSAAVACGPPLFDARLARPRGSSPHRTPVRWVTPFAFPGLSAFSLGGSPIRSSYCW